MSTGSLAVFSPVTLTPEVKETINSLGGKVKYIAAPDMTHHLYVTAWKKAYPEAEVIAPEGLWEKRQSNPEFKDTPFSHIFTQQKYPQQKVSEEFDSEFETEYVYGHASRELVFLHKRSGSLIEADLLFNLPGTEQYSKTSTGAHPGIFEKVFAPLMSAIPASVWQKRMTWYLLASGDRRAFGESMRRIDGWEFDRIIPCHGDVVETGGKGVFREIMGWFLGDGKKRD